MTDKYPMIPLGNGVYRICVPRSAVTGRYKIEKKEGSMSLTMAEVISEAMYQTEERNGPMGPGHYSRYVGPAEIAAALTAAGFGSMADAWDRGFASGKSRAMRAMSDEPNLPITAPNPYGRA